MNARDFDPHQYALDLGWEWDHIEASAQGLGDYDVHAIEEVYGKDAPTVKEALLQWCRDTVSKAPNV